MLCCFAKATPFRFKAAALEMIRPIAIETSHIRANVCKVTASITFSAGCDLSSITDLVRVLAEMNEAWHLFKELYATMPVSIFAWNMGVHQSFEADDFSVPLKLSLYGPITQFKRQV